VRLNKRDDGAHGFQAYYLTYEPIERPKKELGYENVDDTAVNRVLLSTEDFDSYAIGPITYTVDDYRGSNRVIVYQAKGGEVIPLTN